MLLHVFRPVGTGTQPLRRVFGEEALDQVFGGRIHVFGEGGVLL